MVQSSLLVTKPGALTCTEAASLQVPMVLFSPIPGQEEENATYMQQKGCARWVKDQDDLVVAVAELMTHPDELCTMSRAGLACHRDGARIIANRTLQLLYPQRATADVPNQQCSNASV